MNCTETCKYNVGGTCVSSDQGMACPIRKRTAWQDHDAALITRDDKISHPQHYTYGKIECIDYIRDKGFDFCLGNAIKYITRAGHKDNAIEDLKKAIKYIEFEIEVLNGKDKPET